MSKNQGGRPTLMTESLVNKLEEGFMIGLTDREACLYVNISHQTLYNYCEKHPEFVDRKEILKDSPRIKAKLNIDNALKEKDKDISKWYLERKSKAEFSLKTEVDNNISGSLEINKEDKELLDTIKKRLDE